MKRLLPIPCLVLVLAVSGSDRVGEESGAGPRPEAHPALVDRLERLEAEQPYLDLWAPLRADEAAALRAYRQPQRLPRELHLPPERRRDYVDLHARARPCAPRVPLPEGR